MAEAVTEAAAPAPAAAAGPDEPSTRHGDRAPAGIRRLGRRAVSKQVVQPVVGLIALLAIWQLVVRLGKVSIYILPAPSDMWVKFANDPGHLASSTLVTFREAALGLVIALVVGVVVGTLIGYSGTARRVVYPYLVILQVTPIVATAPLLSIWFGYGLESKILITFLIAFFPITVGMATGLRSASAESRLLMRSLAVSRWDEFCRMRLPYAMVHLVAGLRIAAPATVIGAIIAEFVSSKAGLGNDIIRAQSALDTPLLFVALVGAAVMGLLFFGVVSLIEYRFLKWHESARDGLG
jgi:NitT/TauT family transport system permease protein